MITVVSLGVGSSFVYDGQEYIIVKVPSDGGFNLITPISKRYRLPQHFYSGDSVTLEYLNYVCDEYIGVK